MFSAEDPGHQWWHSGRLSRRLGRSGLLRGRLLQVLWLVLPLLSITTDAQQPEDNDRFWSISHVKRISRQNSGEIMAATAAVTAARERAVVVSSLEDPMLMTGIDHYPYNRRENRDSMDPMSATSGDERFDWSVAIEQRFPLSGERRFRRLSADARARSQLAVADEIVLNVEAQAAQAFAMLWENRRMQEVVRQQLELAEQLVDAASARFSAARGGQVDLLQAEVERERLKADAAALQAEEVGAMAMLNARLGRQTNAPIPPLLIPNFAVQVPSETEVLRRAIAQRPELAAGAAEIEGAQAEKRVMGAMYKPMAVVRLGTASTMTEGEGAMVMVGISLPIWRDKLNAGVAEAIAMETMAKADRAAMQRMIEGEALSARAQVIAMQKRYQALLKDVLPRARATLSPAMAGYASGTASLPGVIDAAKSQWMAEADLAMAETQLIIANARLDRAIAARGPHEK